MDAVIHVPCVNCNENSLMAPAPAFNAKLAVVANELDVDLDAEVANDADTARDADVANEAVPVNAPTRDPENDPVATMVSVLPPLNASIARVTCSA